MKCTCIISKGCILFFMKIKGTELLNINAWAKQGETLLAKKCKCSRYKDQSRSHAHWGLLVALRVL